MTTLPYGFEPEHCAGAVAHRSQREFQFMLDDPGCFETLWPQTLSGFDGQELVAIGGSSCFDGLTGGWLLWTDKVTPQRFARVHRTVLRCMIALEQHGFHVIAHLDPDSPNAVRWAGLLGLDSLRSDLLPNGRRMLRAERNVQ